MNRKMAGAVLAALLAAGAAVDARAGERLFLDVHELGSVTAADVAQAHAKDLAVQAKHGVNFIRYWVDEQQGRVYCLAEAPDAGAMSAAHAEAHGLVPQHVYEVASGAESPGAGKTRLYLDVHRVGAGKVTAADVAAAHEKDLATEGKYGVHFVNYWVDEDSGEIFCLSEAPDAEAVLATHREAHGLVSDEIMEVQQGE